MAQIYTTSGWKIPRNVQVWEGSWKPAKSVEISTEVGWRVVFSGTDPDVVQGLADSANATQEQATRNAALIQAAINKASAKGGGRVVIPQGTYCVFGAPVQTPKPPTISVRSNVEVAIPQGATLKNTGHRDMFGSFLDGETFQGYTGPSNWTIGGEGTIDNNGHWAKSQNVKTVAFRLTHTSGGTIKDLTVLNTFADHCVDAGGNRNLTVDGVKFKGWLPGTSWGGDHGWPYIEVIQVDAAHSRSGGGPAFDNATTDGLFVRNCWAGPSETAGAPPVFVGSHGANLTLDGNPAHPYRNIHIEDNVVADYLGSAVRVFGWHDSSIKNNQFSSRHDHPKVGTADEQSKAAILVHSPDKNAHRNVNVEIEDNTLTNTGRPGCRYAAISVNQAWRKYNADGTIKETQAPTAGSTGITIRRNHSVNHAGTDVISSQLVPGIVIEDNTWDAPKTNNGVWCDDMSNVSNNGKVVNAKDFGIKEGNVNNTDAERNADAFQRAIDEVARAPHGGTVLVPDGQYAVRHSPSQPGGPIMRIKTDVHFKMSDGTVILRQGGGQTFGSFSVEDQFKNYNGPADWTISGGTIDGNATNSAEWGHISVIMGLCQTTRGTVRDMRITNVYANHAIDCIGNKDLTIDNVTFEGFLPSKANRFDAQYPDYKGTVWRSHGYPYIEAIQVDRAFEAGGAPPGASDGSPTDGLTVRDCTVKASSTHGTWPVFVGSHAASKKDGATTTKPYTRITIEENDVQDYLGAAVRVFGWTDSIVRNNTFKSRHDHKKYGRIDEGSKAAVVIHSLEAANHANANITVSGNKFDTTGNPACKYAAVSVEEAWRWYRGNGEAVTYTGAPASSGIVIKDNELKGHRGSHVINASNSPGVTITGNKWSGQSTTGRSLYAPDAVNVSGNGSMFAPMSKPSFAQASGKWPLGSWSAYSGAEKYYVQWRRNGGTWYPSTAPEPLGRDVGNTLSFQMVAGHFNTAKTGDTIDFRVRAWNTHSSFSPWSDAGSLKLTKQQAAPANLQPWNKSWNTAGLKWDAVEGAAGYDVRVRDDASVKDEREAVVETEVELKPGGDSGPEWGKAYAYEVCIAGTGGWVTVEHPWGNVEPVPPKVARVEHKAGDDFEVAWDARAHADQYTVTGWAGHDVDSPKVSQVFMAPPVPQGIIAETVTMPDTQPGTYGFAVTAENPYGVSASEHMYVIVSDVEEPGEKPVIEKVERDYAQYEAMGLVVVIKKPLSEGYAEQYKVTATDKDGVVSTVTDSTKTDWRGTFVPIYAKPKTAGQWAVTVRAVRGGKEGPESEPFVGNFSN
ncbi:hypothetical protein ABZV77_11635 [Streptomyces sp. NPDC004732]|uniref:hypothetical protein n=1 Tax=Streptomyces sp. NPDC004732 TaxID=3154290 RepID=UPI0033B3886E